MLSCSLFCLESHFLNPSEALSATLVSPSRLTERIFLLNTLFLLPLSPALHAGFFFRYGVVV